MVQCSNCEQWFSVQRGIRADGSLHYPVAATAVYCPFCGVSFDEDCGAIKSEASLECLQAIDPGILDQLETGIQAGPGWVPDEIDPDDLAGWAQ